MKKWGFLLFMMLSFMVLSGFCIWHDWVDANCELPQTCRDCGKTKGEALGHVYQAATCEKAETCSVCGAARGEALGHDVQGLTCTTDGTCARCGYIEQTPGHAYQAATCEKAETCGVCGAVRGEALGHDVRGLTCTADGACVRCSYTERAPGHAYQAATCEKAETCGVCGAVRGEALGHDVQGLTCTTDGTCVRCGYIRKTPGHVMLPANREQPMRCSNCSLTQGEPIEAPWYAGLNAFSQLKETAIGEMGRQIGALSTYRDEIEYTIHQEGAQILHDDGERVLLMGNTMLYLAARDGKRTIIHAAIQTDDFLRIDSVYSEGIERAQNFGDGVMFTTTDAEHNYCVYYLDWTTLALHKVFRSQVVYPSFDADYWVCGTGDKMMVIDFGKTKIYTGSCGLKSWGITRVNSNGAVLYHGKEPKGYLCFENMALFDTLMESPVAYAGDDYYIHIADFALEFVKENSKETWIKRIDDPALQGKETYYQAIGNLLYFSSGGSFPNASLIFMSQGEDDSSEYVSQLRSGLGHASVQRRYMAINASKSSFANWYILKLGTNEYIRADEAACSLMHYTDYYISESLDGYLMNRSNNPLYGTGYCYKKLQEEGYRVYHFDKNKSTSVKVELADTMAADALR